MRTASALSRYDALVSRRLFVFDDPDRFVAGTVGEPGSRTFFLQVRQGSADYASMLEWFDRVGYDVHIRSRSRECGIAPTSLATWAGKTRWS